MSRSVGVLGGAFNPPHVAHLLLAQEAIHDLGLDELILVPAGVAPHKRIDPEPGAGVRLEMTRLAVEGADRMSASDVEVRREGPSFAFRTLELLQDALPGSDLTFVMGADVAAGLDRWKRPERVLELARIAIAARPGSDPEAAESALERLGGAARAVRIKMPAIDVSSSQIRARVAGGSPIRWLVPDLVAGLIAERGLYRDGTPA